MKQRSASPPRGATPKQLRYLADLRKQLGKGDQPLPETRQGAYHAIQAALQQIKARPIFVHQAAMRASALEPTAEQLHDLAVLARRVGEPIPTPQTRGEAAQELHRLKGMPKEP